ncbi:uncharacterized protein LOC119335806 [Triticum dicoccoides]|uniref:F-box domain-containing protein n=1 Tax=Triticum turgidum subsp. durum TaxID=4567 RepID=A0A9R1ACR6_TRITD|nr:uncharacterized protein LOC119335806 [Triticum dicoccoides]VAI92307.1 unnamed protein product [Triticum turgidum subsp. durum]
MELGTRRRRRSSEPGPAGGPDYLSALPEDLLLLVLARLGCAAAAARTGLVSRRWRGLWARLRDLAFRGVAFPSLQVALGRVALPPPAVSLLQIRVSDEHLLISDDDDVTSVLRAAALLAPEKLVFALPWDPDPTSTEVDLPCFHRATSIVLEWIPFVLRTPAAGAEFPALQTLTLTGCQVDDLGALLSLCPHLRVLRLKGLIWLGDYDWTVHSTSLQELVMDSENLRARPVDIVAPMLKQLTLFLHAYNQVTVSILAPMLENVSWQCLYGTGIIGFGLWTLEKLSLHTAEKQEQASFLQIHACKSWFTFSDEEANFAQEIEKHMIVDFSALELHLSAMGHVFGAFVSHLLGLNRIRNAIRRLKVNLLRLEEEEICPANCPCESTNWRTQIISLTALEEVEIDGFRGDAHELHFLKLIFSCAPMLKRMIVRLSDEVLTSNDRCTEIYDIFRGYSSVKCNVYLSSGLVHRSQGCRLT